MRPKLSTRKPIDGMTIEDLRAFPIWEFADDEEGVEGRDETWVRPVNARQVSRDAFSLSVASDFHTSSGAQFSGFVSVTTFGQVEIGCGVILANGKYIFVPAKENLFAERDFEQVASKLGMSITETYPLRFVLTVLLDGESNFRSGVFDL